jgi:hypothetical protein
VGSVEGLVRAYARHVRLPWEAGLAGPQKVWFALYSPADERRLRARLGAFEVETKQAGHGWRPVDLTDTFAHWMAGQEYRDAYFEAPEDVDLILGEFAAAAAGVVREGLAAAGEGDVVAVTGVASLFGLARVSQVVQEAAPSVRGRLLLFFPGERESGNYRLLDARDGWNYLAVPITAED